MSELALLALLAAALEHSDPMELQDYRACVPAVHAVATALPKVTVQEVRVFLAAFGSSACDKNVEFGEYGNEVMWDLIEQEPGLFFDQLFASGRRSLERVTWEINHPIHDGINVCRRYRSVENANVPPRLKDRALRLLRPSRDAEVEWIKKWEALNKRKWVYP